MDRPSRNKKSISYSDFLDDDDDEDFATVKVPPSKKARVSLKESQPEKSRKNELVDLPAKARKERVSLDEKLYDRHLEAALILSHLESVEKRGEPLSNPLDEEVKLLEDVPPVLTHFTVDGSCFDGNKPSSLPSEDVPPVLSNCSVDVTSLGLDHISSEQMLSSAVCSKRKSHKVTEQQSKQNEEDEDYRPQNTPENESEFSDLDESEDEEYTVKRKQDKRKTSKKEKKTSPKSIKKEKKPVKLAKTKPQSKVKTSGLSSPEVRSPSAAHPLSARTRSPSTPPVNKSALQSSPAGGRVPKWTPPGLAGRNPSSCQSPPLKSPGLGLRLGLSRLARVKPLHPNSVAH
ncbi:RAD51-associated protein 1 [Tachysurus fulvidraco]|uniref:RAD51-associated protein 1 n=1 Tax=Tachysurus fulvidraco TaxID=1234273 RepID=UPI001FEFE0D2|nr:RAD51-associated protein 1 [Tachysurus fulvidraco]